MTTTYPGWHLWAASNGSPVATRTGSHRPPEGDDGTWARTLIADSPDDLDRQLAEQAAHDAAAVNWVELAAGLVLAMIFLKWAGDTCFSGDDADGGTDTAVPIRKSLIWDSLVLTAQIPDEVPETPATLATSEAVTKIYTAY